MNILHAVGWGLATYIIATLVMSVIIGVYKATIGDKKKASSSDVRALRYLAFLIALAVFLLTL